MRDLCPSVGLLTDTAQAVCKDHAELTCNCRGTFVLGSLVNRHPYSSPWNALLCTVQVADAAQLNGDATMQFTTACLCAVTSAPQSLLYMRPLSSSSKRQRPASSKSPSPNRLRGGLVEDLDGQQLLQEALACAAPKLLIEDLSTGNLDLRLDIHLLHGPAQLPFAVDTSRQACISHTMHGQKCK